MKNKKNLIVIITLGTALLISLTFNIISLARMERALPKPELSEGLRGSFGIDKNINEENLDKYLNRSDSVYRDVRMLEDGANWEEKGGDRYLSGIVEGFEVIPYPMLAGFTSEYIEEMKKENINGLYQGKTLFSQDKEGKYIPNYEESMEILEYYFPKDKYIFIMCGAGGYAGITKNMLISLGWDENKIYNVGGYWNYEGEHSIQIKKANDTYDFWKLTYHNIDFNSLHEVK